MATIQLEAQISTDSLLQALEHLPEPELEALVQKAFQVRAAPHTPHLEPEEARLLEQIQHTVPAEMQARFDTLIAKRDTQTLSNNEHAKLLEIGDQIEQLDAKRIGWLGELAQQRGVTLEALMHDLGIHKLVNVKQTSQE